MPTADMPLCRTGTVDLGAGHGCHLGIRFHSSRPIARRRSFACKENGQASRPAESLPYPQKHPKGCKTEV